MTPYASMLARAINILLALDCFLFCLATLGGSYPFESFSSAAFRAELHGRFYGRSRKWIDAVFALLGQKDHCRTAYFSAKNNLPEDQR